VLHLVLYLIYLVRNQQLAKHSAQAVINTYQGITAGIVGYPASAVAAATVAGFVQLKHC
jgi:hypothetical protein